MSENEFPDGVLFGLRADRRLVRTRGRSPRFIRVDLQSPEAPPREQRLPVSLAFVLDRSGSMAGPKIDKARRAVVQGIRSLSKGDRFAVVVFDEYIDVVVPSTAATPESRREAEKAVRAVEARGCTDLCGGWLRGCEQVGLDLGEDVVGRCLLLTDGIANEGITDHDEIVKHVRALRDRRVATSTFGVGADFDETLLSRMADSGGGNFHFIEVAQQIPDFIAQEVGEALKVTAREVALVVEPGPGVAVDSLNDFPCRRVQSGVWRIEIGALFSGRILDPVIRLSFPAGSLGMRRDVTVRVEDQDGVFGGASGTLRFEWATDDAVETQERDRSVDRRVVELTAARAYQRALERNRQGDYEGARDLLQEASQNINQYAGDDPQTLGTLGTLRLQTGQVARAMDSMDRKRGYSTAHGTLTGRPFGMPGRTASRQVVLLPVGDVRPVVDAAVPPLAEADPLLYGDMILDGRLARVLDGLEPAAPLELGALDGLIRTATEVVPEARVRVIFVSRPLDSGRSSHWDIDRQTAVVSLADLEGPLAAAPQALVAAEIIFHSLHLLGPGFEPEGLGHSEVRGCLYDVARTPAAVGKALEGEGLCPECLQKLMTQRLPPDRLLRLHGVIRELAAGPSLVH
jgi:Ca-activated chloride channel family protein